YESGIRTSIDESDKISSRSRAKESPDNAATKFINAIVGNWCSYTQKKKSEVPQGTTALEERRTKESNHMENYLLDP
ncbi:1576_t:CDS:1, partial [Paraglomus occultum]